MAKATCLDAGGTASLSALTPVPGMHCDRHLPTVKHHECPSQVSGNDQQKLDVCGQKLCLEKQMLALISKNNVTRKMHITGRNKDSTNQNVHKLVAGAIFQ